MQIKKVKPVDPFGMLPEDTNAYQVYFSSDDPLRQFHKYVFYSKTPQTHAQIRESLNNLAEYLNREAAG